MTPQQAKDVVTQIQAVAWAFSDPGRQAEYSRLTKEVALLAASYMLAMEDLDAKGALKDIAEIEALKKELNGSEAKIKRVCETIDNQSFQIKQLKDRLAIEEGLLRECLVEKNAEIIDLGADIIELKKKLGDNA